MNSYKYNRRTSQVSLGTKTQKRMLFSSLVLLIAAVVALSVLYSRTAAFQSAAEQQFSRRINSALIDAIEQVNRLSGGVQSNSSSRLALVRGYIHAIHQINEISLSVSGEKGRLVPAEALSALFDDLDTYERLIQTATSSTLEIRTTLLTHLTALDDML